MSYRTLTTGAQPDGQIGLISTPVNPGTRHSAGVIEPSLRLYGTRPTAMGFRQDGCLLATRAGRGRSAFEPNCQFEKDSLVGVYYAPFDINSKNFMNIPAETEEWLEALSDFLKASSQLTHQGDHTQAVACFVILYRLVETMERGEEIVFADELGSWLIEGDQKAYITAYLTSLAATTAPLIKRDSFQSFADQDYPPALRVASQSQREHREAVLRQQQIRTSK